MRDQAWACSRQLMHFSIQVERDELDLEKDIDLQGLE